MAVGDNLPDIFGGLAQSVMKADGPMYLMDLFEGRDADREMNLRQEASMGGPPMPMGGPLIEQYMGITGDPNMATSMVINDVIGQAGADDGINNAKANTAAIQLFDMYPGTIDPSLVRDVAQEMDIKRNALATAYNDINANIQLQNSMMSAGTGEQFFKPLPGDPNTPTPLPPPVPTSTPTGPYRPPEWRGGPSWAEQVQQGKQEDERLRQLGIDPFTGGRLPADQLYLGGRGSYGSREQVFSEEFRTKQLPLLQVRQAWDAGDLTPQELDAQLESIFVKDMDPAAQKRFEAGDMQTRNFVNRTLQTIREEFGDPVESAIESDPGIVAAATTPAATLPVGPSGMEMDPSLGPLATAPAAITSAVPSPTEFADPSFPIGFGGLPAATQWSAYMPSQVEGYYAPRVEQSYDVYQKPFLGNYFLSGAGKQMPSKEGFGDYMKTKGPEDYPVIDWSELSSGAKDLRQYLDAKKMKDQLGNPVPPDVDTIQRLSGSNAKLTTLIDQGGGEDAIAIALALYHRGQPVLNNMPNRHTESFLSRMYGQVVDDTVLTGGTYGTRNANVEFLLRLNDLNPDIFGGN